MTEDALNEAQTHDEHSSGPANATGGKNRESLPKSPYLDEHGEPQIRPSYFAFLDILGFSDMISKSSGDEALQIVKRLRSVVKSSINDFDYSFRESPTKPTDWCYQFFSDTLVIARPIDSRFEIDKGEPEFGSFITGVVAHLMSMVLSGFFIRGAISFGDVFMDEMVTFGQALIESHVAECKRAIYPRVIFTESVTPVLKSQLEFYRDADSSPHSAYIVVDKEDGLPFVNYLLALVPDPELFFEEELITHKNLIEAALAEFGQDSHLHIKYAWLAAYHNYFSQNFAAPAKAQQWYDNDIEFEEANINAYVESNWLIPGYNRQFAVFEKDQKSI